MQKIKRKGNIQCTKGAGSKAKYPVRNCNPESIKPCVKKSTKAIFFRRTGFQEYKKLIKRVIIPNKKVVFPRVEYTSADPAATPKLINRAVKGDKSRAATGFRRHL